MAYQGDPPPSVTYLQPGDWAPGNTVYLSGDEILPSRRYRVQTFTEADKVYSVPATAGTWLWGDVTHDAKCDEGANDGQPCERNADCPGGQCEGVNFMDIGLIVDAFKNIFSTTTTEAADLKGPSWTPDHDITYADINADVDAFKHMPSGAPIPCVGEPRVGPHNPYYFTGRRLDFDVRDEDGPPEMSLYHYRAREYDALHGRFVQRDPAEYLDGTNLYDYVRGRPTSSTDPDGKRRIPFAFKAFIHRRLGVNNWSPEPSVPLFASEWEFEGDRRTFNSPGSSRLELAGWVESEQIGQLDQQHISSQTWTVRARTGISVRRLIATPSVIQRAQARPLLQGSALNLKGRCWSRLSLRAAASYPFISVAPYIDILANIDVRVVARNRVQINVYLTHDSFPDYEGFLDNQFLYRFRSSASGPGIVNLNLPESSVLDITVLGATPACCRGNRVR